MFQPSAYSPLINPIKHAKQLMVHLNTSISSLFLSYDHGWKVERKKLSLNQKHKGAAIEKPLFVLSFLAVIITIVKNIFVACNTTVMFE